MARPTGSKTKKPTPLIDDSVNINGEFLNNLVNLLASMSPEGYTGFPALTLAEKIKAQNYDLTRWEKLFLLTSLKTLDKLSYELRLGNITELTNEVNKRIEQVEQLKQLDNEAQEAKQSLIQDS